MVIRKDFARRAMADMAFTDIEGFHSMVDVKTHRENTDFNMPNLTSVRRLARLYESDTDYFSLIMIKYQVDDLGLRVSDVLFSPIEFLDWQCLTIGALGRGQIQIANLSINSQNNVKTSSLRHPKDLQHWANSSVQFLERNILDNHLDHPNLLFYLCPC